jgi:HemY protein
MVRALLYIVIVFLLAAGAAWLADRPGEVILHWQGYEIRTSLLVAAVGALVLMAAVAILWMLLRGLVRAPRAFGASLARRRRDRGYRALTAGMIAVGAGDAPAARRAAEEARAALGAEPLVLLLGAQAAQLSGDRSGARTAFEALAARGETRLLGLHGLFVEAQRQGEHEAARHFAAEAAAAAPRIGWAGPALFEYQAREGDWQGAIHTLDANLRAGLIGKEAADHLRATLLTARAIEIEAGEPDAARQAALEAHRIEPGLGPAAVVAARLLARAGDYRKASRILEAAWKAEPQPEIADAYAAVRPGDSMLDRMKRMRRLAELRANHPEGAMALARAAIDARDFAAARAALEGLARAPSERVCLLMAEIEEREHGDEGRVRGWLTRALTAPRDPAWIADGQAFEHWAPIAPVSGRVGAFVWKTPPFAPPREAVEIEEAVGRLAAIQSQPAPPLPLPPASEPESLAEEPSAPSPASPEPQPRQPPVREAVAGPPTADAAEPAAKPPLTIVASRIEDQPPPTSVGTDRAVTADARTPLVPRAPDDPGPLPPEAEETAGRQRRFRLF